MPVGNVSTGNPPLLSSGIWPGLAEALRLSPREVQVVRAVFLDHKEESIAAELRPPERVTQHGHRLGLLSRREGGGTRQLGIGLSVYVEVTNGISEEKARELVKLIKKTGVKVQTQIQGAQVRVTGKKKDDLQSVIQAVKAEDLDIPLQFTNYRP